MAWFPKSVTHSLQWRLLLTLTVVCLLFSGLVATVSFFQSYRQAQTLQDAKLESLVSLAQSHDLSIENDQIDIDFKANNPPNSANIGTNIGTNIDTLEQDIATNQTLVYWLDDGRLQNYFSSDTLYHLTKKADGFYEIQGKNGSWRVYIYTQIHKQVIHQAPNAVSSVERTTHPHPIKPPAATQTKTITKERRLIIGELLDIRNQLAWQSAKKILFPLLLLIPLLLTVIIFTVHRVFKPLEQITTGLSQQSKPATNPSNRLKNLGLQNGLIEPFNQKKLPSEILPFIQVIQEQMQHLLDSLALNERFVSNASHQLRTPMTAILLQAEQIKLPDTATPDQIHEQSQAIDRLLDSIKRNNHLINQLLTLSKSEQPNQLSRHVTFSASQIVTDVLLDFYPIASQKTINLGVAVLQEVSIPIAELPFKIIVQNLVENAIKYTPQGGRVDIGLFSEAGYAYLMVQDSGIGIDEAELDNILEPFYRANAVTHSPHRTLPIEGFGLGLAIVNNLVLASQGEMTIANHQNLDKTHPNFRPDLAEKIKTYTDKQDLASPDPSPLLTNQAVSEFGTGLYVQVRWQNLV